MNTIGGLQPNTVVANITGGLVDFWHIYSHDGYILNWSGECSPAVHQADHFLPELEAIVDKKSKFTYVVDIIICCYEYANQITIE